MACAPTGINPNQLMISKWKHGTEDEAIARAKTIVSEMTGFGLEIVRVKVESMLSNDGVPEVLTADNNPQKYFEFHIKYLCADFTDMDNLDIARRNYKMKGESGISFNTFKEYIKIILTLRLPGNIGRKRAIEEKDLFMDHFKHEGFHFHDEIQSEYCVYDTNPDYDAGWL